MRRAAIRFVPALWVALSAATAFAVPVSPDLPDHSWLLDDAVGSSAAAHTGGQAGSFRGTPVWDADSAFGGAGNGSLYFGGGDALEIPGLATALNGLSAFSLSLWVRSDSIGVDRGFFSGQQLVGAGETRNQDLFGARYDAAGWLSSNQGQTTGDLIKLGITVEQGGSIASYQLESSENLQTTAWQHLVVVFEGGTGLRLYVDGSLDLPTQDQSAGLRGVVAGQASFTLGDGTKAGWSGRIDEAALWTRALGQDEVSWLAANSLTSITAIPEPGTGLLLGVGVLSLGTTRRLKSGRADPA